MVALFPEDLTWRHYRGAADVFGVREAFVAGHEPAVEWYLPEELAEKLPVSFDPRIEQHLKVGEQRLAARAPPVGLQDPVHYRGGLGRTGRAPPQQCRHSVLRCPVRKVFQPAGLQLNAMIGQLPGPPPEVRVTDQPGQFEAIKNLEAMSRKRSRLGLRRRG
jgi:hypothetical protein